MGKKVNTQIIEPINETGFVSIFKPTSNLRYKKVPIEIMQGRTTISLELEQMFIGSNGEREWRKIPIEE